VAVSKQVAFKNPKAPVFPRLAQGKTHDEMTVTWTSGYDISEAYPFVEWGVVTSDAGKSPMRTLAGTLTFNRGSMCGAWPVGPKLSSSIREREETDVVVVFLFQASRRGRLGGETPASSTRRS
jgi:hypothetical protein